jgi:parvulin-like peptidyl-prolyl isomerase
MRPTLIALSVVGLATTACTAPSSDPVIAIWDTGEVRQSDLDREIEFMTKDERQYREIQKMPEERVRLDLIRRIALREIAVQEAERTGIDREPETRERARQAARSWWLSRWRETCYGLPLTLPTDDELRAELEEKVLPKRVRLSHVFLRAEGAEEVEAAIGKLEMWRQTITGLEDFASLARQHSQSESRHRDGRLGWIREGWLSADAERLLFELPAGTVSPPIELRGGVHLFFVEEVRKAEPLPVDRRLRQLRAVKRTAALEECRQQRLDTADLRLQSNEADDWSDITVGDWFIGGATMRSIYLSPDTNPVEVRTRWIEDEALFQTALATGAQTPDERLRLNDLEGNVVLGGLVENALKQETREPSAEQIRARFELNPGRYRAQRRLELEVLWTGIPDGSDPLVFWDRLARTADDLRSGEISFVQAAAAIGGGATTERWPIAPVREAAGALGPLVFDRIKDGTRGSVFGPIQDADRFWIVSILEDEPTRPMTFSEAESRIRAEIIGEGRKAARARIVSEMLESHGFRLSPDGTATDAHDSGA